MVELGGRVALDHVKVVANKVIESHEEMMEANAGERARRCGRGDEFSNSQPNDTGGRTSEGGDLGEGRETRQERRWIIKRRKLQLWL
jgi:hypothetical protein